MLTNIFENAKKKCEKYWPDVGQTKIYGNISITCRNSIERANYIIREMTLEDAVSGQSRYVTHFHFTTWPDHGVPSAPALVSFWKQVEKTDDQHAGPHVVHCSAGIGRTGTFIALENLEEQAKTEDKINIFLCIARLRENRVNMVQTVEQYKFVHYGILEAIESRNTMMITPQFETMTDTTLSSTVENEYKALLSLQETMSINADNNQDEKGADMKTSRSGVMESDFDFMILPSFYQKKGFIITKTPTESTAEDFWQIVQSHNVLTVVSINPTEASQEGCDSYLPEDVGDEKMVGPFHVKLESVSDIAEDLSEATVTLFTDNYESSELEIIKMFTIKGWGANEEVPSSTYSLLLLLDALKKRQKETGYHPVIVHCHDGLSQSGLFAATSNVIVRLKQDREIDVFLTVREFQCINPHCIKSMKQYRFCFDAAREYLSSMDVYANI